jgi:hypothetical protein
VNLRKGNSMRQLTASQKIAVLENRIAQLERQAFLSDVKEKIKEKIEIFKRVQRDVASTFKRAGSPKKVAQSYIKVSKTREYEQAMKELSAQVGPNPIKQVEFLIKAKKNPEIVLDNPLVRRASLRKNAGLIFFLGKNIIRLATLILGCVLKYLLKVIGVRKSASHDKEAGLLGSLLYGVVMFVIGWFAGKEYDLNISLDKKER